MEEEILVKKAPWYFSWYKHLPKWLRIIVIALLSITFIYFTLIMLYKFWSLVGKMLHWISDTRNWWIYSTALMIVFIGFLIISELYGDWKPFSSIGEWVSSWFNKIHISIG